METFYKSFFLFQAFIKADARVATPINLLDAEDRFITRELDKRRNFTVVEVIDVLYDMPQPNLINAQPVEDLATKASLSEQGLNRTRDLHELSKLVSLSPYSSMHE